jgi:hypothetical protein
MNVPEDAVLREVLWRLRDCLDQLVLIGGWVPHVYRFYGGFEDWDGGLALTEELDILVGSSDKPADPMNIADTLAAAGFTPVGEHGAVWENVADRGQRIEFMTPHKGPAASVGTVGAVEGQPGIAAVMLEGLELLDHFTRTVEIPVQAPESNLESLAVRIPLLGAYVVHKAATFPRRPGESGSPGKPRKAKDVLYLRDIMAGGVQPVTEMERDLETIAADRWGTVMRTARNNLYRELDGRASAALTEAAEILAERDRVSLDFAEADIRGHLTDLYEILAATLEEAGLA